MKQIIMDFYNKPSPMVLIHHGVKDQRWGVKNGPPYPIDRKSDSTPTYDYDKMNLSSDSLPTVLLPKQEYAHVMSEVATHISDAQRIRRVFQKEIGHHVYTFENGFDGTYRVIGKEEISGDIYDYYEMKKGNR